MSKTCTPLEFIPTKPGLVATVLWSDGDGYEVRHRLPVMGWVRTWSPDGDMPLLEGWDGDWDSTLNENSPDISMLVLIPAPDGNGFLDQRGDRWPTIRQAGNALARHVRRLEAADRTETKSAASLTKPGSWHGPEQRHGASNAWYSSGKPTHFAYKARRAA